MEKVKDILETLDAEKVVAIESKNDTYFFGTKGDSETLSDEVLNFPIEEKQDINEVLIITVA